MMHEQHSLTCDALNRVLEGIVVRHALLAEAPEQALDHAVHCAQQNAALAIDVAAVLALQGGSCHTQGTLEKPATARNISPGSIWLAGLIAVM